jgi:hypothetical protein
VDRSVAEEQPVTGVSDLPHPDNWYEIRLQGHLDPRWSGWFDDMQMAHLDDGSTVVRGPVVDQSALHGLLARLRDLGLPLLSVTQIEPRQPQHPIRHTSNGD